MNGTGPCRSKAPRTSRVPAPATGSGPAMPALRHACAWQLRAVKHEPPNARPVAGSRTRRARETRMGSLQSLTSGATASSEGSQLVCRLPLAAFIPKTIDVESKRPAAVIRYVEDAYAGL